MVRFRIRVRVRVWIVWYMDARMAARFNGRRGLDACPSLRTSRSTVDRLTTA